ncbi:hypothetical protein G4B88_026916 [Cannabis sativa]|uniref:Rieske domain-containing protein n=1 Tax=Cannabis sativa TaxID=3483 RepID=A0A7J6EGG9_CANSA|nr:hypothetical protein G4B88_026916 [Cannabis sativa]
MGALRVCTVYSLGFPITPNKTHFPKLIPTPSFSPHQKTQSRSKLLKAISSSCVYHGWCFNGSGDCKFIPQAPPDGPPIQTSKKACVAAYPSTVMNDILWFWPNTDPQYKDILVKKSPPYIPELNDPSYISSMGNRDFPFGYEILLENLMDPSHVPYAHYGILATRQPEKKMDREGGRPLDMRVNKLDKNGFFAKQDWAGNSEFIAPCIFYGHAAVLPDKSNKATPKKEHRIMDVGRGPWHKEFFVPTKSDAPIIAFRNWLNKYGGGQVDWKGKFTTTTLPPTPPREQLMDRYWSHVVNCPSCSGAHKGLKVLEVVLQVMSIALIGYAAVATKQGQQYLPLQLQSGFHILSTSSFIIMTMIMLSNENTMVALTSISLLLLHSLPNNKLLHYHSNIKYTKPISSSFSYGQRSTDKASRSKLYTSISSVSTNLTDPFEAELESSQTPDGKFDWYSNWCPIMPVCDLDKRRPHGKKVMGIDVVVWWDKNESEWKLLYQKEGLINGGDCSVSTMVGALMALEIATSSLKLHQMVLRYEVMVENLMDPAHVPYAHHGLMRTRLPGNADREGGIPLEMTLESFNINGFTGMSDPGFNQFYAPFVFYSSMPLNLNQDSDNNQAKKDILNNNNNKTMALVFICVPISPGRSRLILSASNPRRFNDWFNKIIPRWIIHISVNAVLDSDTYLLHLEERKMMDAGVGKWNKACFVPTKSDVHVVAFRKWLNKYGGGQVDWGGKFSGALPPTPPREQLMDRYWSHVVNCSSCSAAHKGLKVLEVMLQVMSIALIGYRSTDKASRSKLYTSISSVSTNLTDPFEAELESTQTPDGKFDWYSN